MKLYLFYAKSIIHRSMIDLINISKLMKMKYFKLIKNILISLLLLVCATILSYIVTQISPQSQNIVSLIYILFIVLIAVFTSSYFLGIISSLISVICINYSFTYPYNRINFTITGYPITFLLILSISLITSATATNLKKQSYILKERERMLMEAEKEKMCAMLLRSISHDLRTPLTSIIGSYKELSDYEKKEFVSHILEDGNWLLHVVENILSITKIQNNTQKIKKTVEPIEEVISEAASRVKKRLPKSSIEIKLADDLIMIPMNPLLIEQVIINLLENAVIHSKTTKPIDCYITETPNTVTVHVRDYGIGISKDCTNYMFDNNLSVSRCNFTGFRFARYGWNTNN